MGKSSSKQKKPADDGCMAGPSVDPAIADHFRNGNMKEIVEQMNSKMQEWKQIPLNIAVIGSSGSGKSTLINTLRGLNEDDKLAAPVGVEETTTECTPYKHPFNDNFVLWDLPGCGTKNFPKSTYLNTVGFTRYDFFVICSCKRFTENDIWLAKKIKKIGKNFYMLRTMLDDDLRKAKRNKPMPFDDARFIESIKEKYRNDLNGDYKLFLISSIHPEKWDFPEFEQTLIQDCPDEKRESLILSLRMHSMKAVEQKRKILQTRINFVCLASAAGGAIPVPGVSAAIDIAIIKTELEFYKEQLGLSAKSKAKSMERMKTSLTVSITTTMILGVVKSVAGGALEKAATYFLPVVGSLAAASIAYTLTNYTLRKFLKEMCEDATKVIVFASGTLAADNQTSDTLAADNQTSDTLEADNHTSDTLATRQSNL